MAKSKSGANVIKLAGQFIAWAVLIIITMLTAYIMISNMQNKPAVLFGRSIVKAVSGSMEPSIHSGDYIMIEKTDSSELKAGDIICFYSHDSAIYGMLNTHRIVRILDDGRIPVLPYKRPMSKKGFFPPYEYVYDEYFNCVICPENQVLSYATTNREGYREFKSKGYICENCPSRHLCTENQKFEKTVTKHIWSDYLETVEDIRHTPEYKALYERRKETIERVFADAKEKYAMRYTPYRGLSQVTNWVRLKFAAMNLKKYALHRWKRSRQYSALIRLYTFFAKTKLITLNLA